MNLKRWSVTCVVSALLLAAACSHNKQPAAPKATASLDSAATRDAVRADVASLQMPADAKDAFYKTQGDSSGFGFAGAATNDNRLLVRLALGIGMIPTLVAMGQADADVRENIKALDTHIDGFAGALEADVVTALHAATAAGTSGDANGTLKAILDAMAAASQHMNGAHEREHGYVTVGLYAGLALVFAVNKHGNETYADLATPLIQVLEQDAAFGGADRTIATQLKVVQAELRKQTPAFDAMWPAVEAIKNVHAD